MKTYEYMTRIWCSATENKSFAVFLNNKGKQGWKYISKQALPRPSDSHFLQEEVLFEREKEKNNV